MLNMNWKKWTTAALCGLMLLTLPACQEDPDGSIVAHKDMDKLISQGAASDESHVDAGELISAAQETETYRTTLENEGLGVKVNVDAQVEVPQVEKLSIYRVKQKPFDQEFVDKVRQELCGDVTLYDGCLTEVRTKAEVETEIKLLREAIANAEANLAELKQSPPPEGEGRSIEEIEEDAKANRQEMQREIDRLQEEYENTPAEVNYADYPTDGQIKTVQEMYDRNPNDDFYSWLQSLSGEGDEVFYGVSDGSDGQYQTLYVLNNADYSNTLLYEKSPAGHSRMSVLGNETRFDTIIRPEHMGIQGTFEDYYREKGVPGNVIPDGAMMEPDVTYTPVGSTTLNTTQEEARETAEGLLERLGLSGFKFTEGGLYTEMDTDTYRVNYILKYKREVDGVMLTQSSGMKYQDGYTGEGGSYNKQLWPGENIEVRIDNSGIVGFRYNSPLAFTETVVEGTSLKSFDEVKGIFEQMLPVTQGSNDYQKVIHIDKVRLSYSRISEKDSFDTGLVVPVWSFEGKASAYDGEYLSYEDKGTLLAVNAIDGSVIDSTLGY